MLMRENTNIEKSGPGAYILLREFTVFNVHPFFWKKILFWLLLSMRQFPKLYIMNF